MDHQERGGSGETEAATNVKKTLSNEKLQNTGKIDTEIKNMHEQIVEVDQVMESNLISNDKGVHDDKFCKKE